MKLLFCGICGDIFNLDLTEKTCRCGETKGKYVNLLNAVYSGDKAIPLGIANHTFRNALQNRPISGKGETFTAFVIPQNCETFKKNVPVIPTLEESLFEPTNTL